MATSSRSTRKKLARRASLRDITLAAGSAGRFIADEAHRSADRWGLGRLAGASALSVPVASLRGRSVLIATELQLPAVLAALALDGVAGRILLCPPDLAAANLPRVIADAGVDALVTDAPRADLARLLPGMPAVTVSDRADSADMDRTDGLSEPEIDTEWVLFTSGTTGQPKLVRHSLPSLTGPLADGLVVPSGAVWSTFYDVRRYGGLQILFRALLGGGSMVLSSAREPVGAFLQRAGREGVTHMSGTPSHWRRALMSPDCGAIAPAYVRLSGEIADQAILDRLHAAYPSANIAHAFASTEAGVAFDVRDGLAGFPVSTLAGSSAEMRVDDGTLRVRSRRTAAGYLGAELAAPDGFVDTGDMVERRGDRYYFMGRKEGVINVGGQKVYPEEVEAVINAEPAIRMSRVWSRTSPVTGAIVAADLVLEEGHADFAAVRDRVLQACRDALPAYKVPVTVRQAASLAIAESGKLVRQHA